MPTSKEKRAQARHTISNNDPELVRIEKEAGAAEAAALNYASKGKSKSGSKWLSKKGTLSAMIMMKAHRKDIQKRFKETESHAGLVIKQIGGR